MRTPTYLSGGHNSTHKRWLFLLVAEEAPEGAFCGAMYCNHIFKARNSFTHPFIQLTNRSEASARYQAEPED